MAAARDLRRLVQPTLDLASSFKCSPSGTDYEEHERCSLKPDAEAPALPTTKTALEIGLPETEREIEITPLEEPVPATAPVEEPVEEPVPT